MAGGLAKSQPSPRGRPASAPVRPAGTTTPTDDGSARRATAPQQRFGAEATASSPRSRQGAARGDPTTAPESTRGPAGSGPARRTRGAAGSRSRTSQGPRGAAVYPGQRPGDARSPGVGSEGLYAVEATPGPPSDGFEEETAVENEWGSEIPTSRARSGIDVELANGIRAHLAAGPDGAARGRGRGPARGSGWDGEVAWRMRAVTPLPLPRARTRPAAAAEAKEES